MIRIGIDYLNKIRNILNGINHKEYHMKKNEGVVCYGRYGSRCLL